MTKFLGTQVDTSQIETANAVYWENSSEWLAVTAGELGIGRFSASTTFFENTFNASVGLRVYRNAFDSNQYTIAFSPLPLSEVNSVFGQYLPTPPAINTDYADDFADIYAVVGSRAVGGGVLAVGFSLGGVAVNQMSQRANAEFAGTELTFVAYGSEYLASHDRLVNLGASNDWFFGAYNAYAAGYSPGDSGLSVIPTFADTVFAGATAVGQLDSGSFLTDYFTQGRDGAAFGGTRNWYFDYGVETGQQFLRSNYATAHSKDSAEAAARLIALMPLDVSASTAIVFDFAPNPGDIIDATKALPFLSGVPGVLMMIGDNGPGDILIGHNGADHIEAAAGNDMLYGLGGNDWLSGGSGDDLVAGGAGADLMDGGDGFDAASWLGASAPVRINLTNQAQNAFAAEGDTALSFEVFYLTNSSDVFTAAGSGLYIYGFNGDDIITGSPGTDFIDGGEGSDILDGGDGFDYVSWGSSASGVSINFLFADHAWDRILNFEAFYLSNGNDTFVGQPGSNIVFGLAGDDFLTFSTDSSDWLFGGDGDDALFGGAFDDLLSGGAGADHYFLLRPSGDGFDQVLDFETGVDKFGLEDTTFGLPVSSLFVSGTTFIAGSAPVPVVASGTMLYNTLYGILSYDMDGTGPAPASAMVQIAGAPTVAAGDFFVF